MPNGHVLLSAVVLVAVTLLGGPAGAAELKAIDPLTTLWTRADAESAEPREAVYLAAPRGGTCSAVAVWLPDEGDGPCPVAATTALTGPGGAPPADAVQVRYALKPELEGRLEVNMEDRSAGFASEWSVQYTNRAHYDTLAPTPPGAPGMVPVWVTVDVPRDMAPGRYAGTLRVGDLAVPVELQVARHVLPPPSEWREHAGFDISLSILAETYDVPLWSEEHWALIDRTLRLLAEMGNDDVHLPVYVRDNYLGRMRPMVRFVRDADGGLVPDLSLVERFLRLYHRYLGPPTNLVIDLWDPAFAMDRGRRRGQAATAYLLARGAQGEFKTTPAKAPPSESAHAYCGATWDALRELTQGLGWPEDALKLGYASDRRPDRETVRFFAEIAPAARWALFTHMRGVPVPTVGDEDWVIDGMPVGQGAHVYVSTQRGPAPEGADWPAGVRGGWRLPFNMPTYARLWLYDYSPLGQFRFFPDAIMGELGEMDDGELKLPIPADGFLHVGFNFWELPGGGGPRSRRGKQPQWANMLRSGVNTLVAPGPEGPLSTVRREMFRKGQQDAQARVDIEEAMLSGGLDADLLGRCSAFLTELARVRSRDGELFDGFETYIQMDYRACLYGRPERADRLALRLYELAAEVNRPTEGWRSLFDGRTLDGWQANEHHETWRVEDGCITVEGPFSHLFYLGPDGDAMFDDFELKLEVKTAPGTNSGVFFRTPPMAECDKYLNGSVEAQIQNDGQSPCYTGGLWARAPRTEPSPVKPNEWFEMHIICIGNDGTLKSNGETTTEYSNPRIREKGHIALQGHGRRHRPMFRNIRIRPIADGSEPGGMGEEGTR